MKIIFHHLAKTAGTSLIQSFKRHFGKRTCPARYDFELNAALMASDEFDFFHGHFSFDKVEEFRRLNPESFVFTFVRNPVNRVISQYYNWVDRERTEKEFRSIAERGGVGKDFVQNQMAKFEKEFYGKSLLEFLNLKDPKAIEVYENHQVRYLSRNATYRADRIKGLVEACGHLERFYDFVGLTESYASALDELSRRLGFPAGTLSAGIVRNTNEAQKRDGAYRITSEEWNRLLDYNGLDLTMFSFAAGMVRARYPGLGPLEADLHLPIVSPS